MDDLRHESAIWSEIGSASRDNNDVAKGTVVRDVLHPPSSTACQKLMCDKLSKGAGSSLDDSGNVAGIGHTCSGTRRAKRKKNVIYTVKYRPKFLS
jgi:hypothetical protein